MKKIKQKSDEKRTIKSKNSKAINAFKNTKSAFIRTRENIEKSENSDMNSAEGYAENKVENTAENVIYEGISQIKKQSNSVLSSEKTIGKYSNENAIRTANKSAQSGVKTSQQAVQTMNTAAKRTKETASKAGKAIAKGVKETSKAVVTAVKATASAAKSTFSLIAAGGWISGAVIVIVSMAALIICSAYGVIFSTGDETMQTVIKEIDNEFDKKIQEEIEKTSYDVFEINGSRADWKEVLAVYAVKVNTDPDNPQEVVTMNEHKKQVLRNVFWDMNSISSNIETKTETAIEETTDEHGNIVQTEKQIVRKYLIINVSHKSVDEMAEKYGFNEEQKEHINHLILYIK